MDRDQIQEELKGIIEEFLRGQGFELVDLIFRYEGRDLFLRILADAPEGGIRLAECVRLNREISQMLEERDMVQERYILEVSSPGLDRPLKTKSDFARCLNKKARFFLKSPLFGKVEFEGTIAKVEGDSVYVESSSETLEVPLATINMAKQVVI